MTMWSRKVTAGPACVPSVRTGLVRTVVAAALVSALAPCAAQTLPSTPGFQVPGVEGLGSRRGNQGWVNETSFLTQATLTNNANYGEAGPKDGDLVLEFVPSWRFNRQGGRLRVDGTVSLDMIGYVDGTQANRILPRANVLANLEAIDNFFFIDAALFVDQQVENVFLPTSRGASTNNLYTSSQVRLAPYFQGNIGPNVRWLVRSDQTYTWTSQSDAPLDNAYYARNLAEVVRAPTPLGLTLRLTNDITRVRDQLQEDQTLNTALAIFDYAVSPQLTVGLRGGYESTTYTAVKTSGPIYGANLTWRPSPLTVFDGYWEERFYGPSYQYRFTHRQRRVATSITGYRTVSTYPQVLFQIPSTNSVSGLLDAILVARFPDPVERAQQSQDLIARQGLPESLPAGAFIYNQSANVLTGANASWALTGVRNTLALSLFYLKTNTLPDPRVPPSFLILNNSIQQGGGLSLSHRLTPVVALSAGVNTSRTKGFDVSDGLDTRESSATLQANWQASPRSTLFVGARYQIQTESSGALPGLEQNEAAIYTGLFHRL